jgi:hypothetical protein
MDWQEELPPLMGEEPLAQVELVEENFQGKLDWKGSHEGGKLAWLGQKAMALERED